MTMLSCIGTSLGLRSCSGHRPRRYRPELTLLEARTLLSVTIAVDAAAGRHAISPNIYGLNAADNASLVDLNVTYNRNGGNLTSRYNWQLDAANHAQDFYWESLPEGGAAPAGSRNQFIADTKAAGAEPSITIPTIGWVAKLGPNGEKLASYSVAKYGAQTGNDQQFFPDAGNGIRAADGSLITNNDPNDANVPATVAFQKGWVDYLVNRFGAANGGGVRYYALDNEPGLWHETHRDVHPTGATTDEVVGYLESYGAMIKAADPHALVLGPEEWGYDGFLRSGFDKQQGGTTDRDAHDGMDYLPYLLKRLHQDQGAGPRLLDVLSVHDYPQGQWQMDAGGGIHEIRDERSGNGAQDDVSPATQLLRNRSTRSLWDPSYVDESWIGLTQDAAHNKVQLIPRLKDWVNTYYPGTKLGITEYDWGAPEHMNGATTEADVLGIFGREGLDLANIYSNDGSSGSGAVVAGTPLYNAFKMYRNYDGQKSTFGDTGVATTVPNPDEVSAFSAVRSSDGSLTVMVVNKTLYDAQNPTTSVQLNLSNFTGDGTAQVWQLAADNPADMSRSSIQRRADVAYGGAGFTLSVPDQSVTLFVLHPAAVQPAPAVTYISPAAGPDTGGTTVTIRGSDFTGATAVTFGQVPATSFRVTFPTEIMAVAPAQAAGTQADIRVTTPGGTSAASAADVYTYTSHGLPNPGLFQFHVGAATVSELGMTITIIVDRVSGSDGVVTVDYFTGDSSAHAGQNYRSAAGTLAFADGQTTRSFVVTILHDGLVTDDVQFVLALNNATGGAALGQLLGDETVTITDADLPQVPDSPPPAELITAATIFAHSHEHYTEFVNQTYLQLLGRGPDPSGLAYWLGGMERREISDEQLEAFFIGSPEYIVNHGGQGRGWISGMYQNLLGRTPSEDELQSWLAVLAQGVSTRTVAFSFAAGTEREGIRVRFNYQTYLGRGAGSDEVSYWVAAFTQGISNEDMVAGFVGSPEYYRKPARGRGNRAHWVAWAYRDVLFRGASVDEANGWIDFLA